MGDAARKLSTADERRAALLALPLREEPTTPEEDAIFEEAERFVRSGQRGVPHAEVQATLERMRRERGG